MDGAADRGAAVEVGATAAKQTSEHGSQIGPTIEIEFEPIENWLEIEFGASGNRSQRATNWEFELQFKKPFQISSTLEIEPGLGPSWSQSQRSGERPTEWGAEASVDFVFWRTKRVGWFLEPSYSMSFANGTKTSIGLSGGIICTFH